MRRSLRLRLNLAEERMTQIGQIGVLAKSLLLCVWQTWLHSHHPSTLSLRTACIYFVTWLFSVNLHISPCIHSKPCIFLSYWIWCTEEAPNSVRGLLMALASERDFPSQFCNSVIQCSYCTPGYVVKGLWVKFHSDAFTSTFIGTLFTTAHRTNPDDHQQVNG